MTAVGFTGTRGDLPVPQFMAMVDAFAELDQDDPGQTLHMGCCVGADEAAAHAAKNMGYRIHAWPPINRKYLANIKGDVNHTPMTYGNRNLSIVQHADVLVACPAGPEQDWPRSGTWMTVRIARRLGVPRVIVFPDGRVSTDGG